MLKDDLLIVACKAALALLILAANLLWFAIVFHAIAFLLRVLI